MEDELRSTNWNRFGFKSAPAPSGKWVMLSTPPAMKMSPHPVMMDWAAL
jgi:hypothetical protein